MERSGDVLPVNWSTLGYVLGSVVVVRCVRMGREDHSIDIRGIFSWLPVSQGVFMRINPVFYVSRLLGFLFFLSCRGSLQGVLYHMGALRVEVMIHEHCLRRVWSRSRTLATN